jgi:DNA-binding transcriptional MerR regulator
MGAMDHIDSALPPIPAKRYFTIGEVSELCLVKPYVLRYWEQEFVQLKPMKRRGNRRYYQHHEVLLIRRIRELLYEQGFTIVGARNQLAEMGVVLAAPIEFEDDAPALAEPGTAYAVPAFLGAAATQDGRTAARALQSGSAASIEAMLMTPELPELSKLSAQTLTSLRETLLSIRDLLS